MSAGTSFPAVWFLSAVTPLTRRLLVYFDSGAYTPDGKHSKIISQVMYEAALANNLDLPSNGILYQDVPRGMTHKGARAGARTNKEHAAACQTISDIWKTI